MVVGKRIMLWLNSKGYKGGNRGNKGNRGVRGDEEFRYRHVCYSRESLKV